jgi:hypothetical protein
MYCTTQCDWSSSSWLKSTITPAVIKGQKEHHQQLVAKIKGWIKDHPDEFGHTGEDFDIGGEEEDDEEGDVKAARVDGVEVVEVDVVRGKGLDEHLREVYESPKMMGLVGLCLVLFWGLIYEWKSG